MEGAFSHTKIETGGEKTANKSIRKEILLRRQEKLSNLVKELRDDSNIFSLHYLKILYDQFSFFKQHISNENYQSNLEELRKYIKKRDPNFI